MTPEAGDKLADAVARLATSLEILIDLIKAEIAKDDDEAKRNPQA